MKSIKVGEILATPAPKNGKGITNETFHLVRNIFEDDNFGRWCLKRKTMLVWIKEYINKKFATCKSLCNLQEFYTAFRE